MASEAVMSTLRRGWLALEPLHIPMAVVGGLAARGNYPVRQRPPQRHRRHDPPSNQRDRAEDVAGIGPALTSGHHSANRSPGTRSRSGGAFGSSAPVALDPGRRRTRGRCASQEPLGA